MHTDENNAIRYLMSEMDPSEEVEFEKLMREDEDLLIEVESLRATSRKLSALPKKNPPEQITKSITNEANQLQSNNLSKFNYIAFIFKKGIAATILIAAISGGYYYYSEFFPEPVNPSLNATENIAPWVDRNDILRFTEDLQVTQSSALKNDFTKSYEKLQLVNDPTAKDGENSGILLTGSSN